MGLGGTEEFPAKAQPGGAAVAAASPQYPLLLACPACAAGDGLHGKHRIPPRVFPVAMLGAVIATALLGITSTAAAGTALPGWELLPVQGLCPVPLLSCCAQITGIVARGFALFSGLPARAGGAWGWDQPAHAQHFPSKRPKLPRTSVCKAPKGAWPGFGNVGSPGG